VLRDQCLQFRNDIGVLSELESSVDLLLDDGLPQFVDARALGLQRRLLGEVRKGGTTPERQRGAELRISFTRRKRPRLGDETLEPAEVDCLWSGAENVAPRLGYECLAPDLLAQPGDVVLECRGGVRRRMVAPQVLDQPVSADDLVRLEHEQSEHGTALRTPQVERATVPPNLQRPEHSELHHSLTVTLYSAPKKGLKAA
jgi:hypothetical protein